MKNTRVSSIVCFTILVLPVLVDEEYWSFQYRVFYNTSITSIVGWRILELSVLCIDQRFWYSSIVNARYWYIQYCIHTILDFRYCNITILVFLILYSVTILVLPVSRPAASYYPNIWAYLWSCGCESTNTICTQILLSWYGLRHQATEVPLFSVFCQTD
jgi:hypothetical protein